MHSVTPIACTGRESCIPGGCCTWWAVLLYHRRWPEQEQHSLRSFAPRSTAWQDGQAGNVHQTSVPYIVINILQTVGTIYKCIQPVDGDAVICSGGRQVRYCCCRGGMQRVSQRVLALAASYASRSAGCGTVGPVHHVAGGGYVAAYKGSQHSEWPPDRVSAWLSPTQPHHPLHVKAPP